MLANASENNKVLAKILLVDDEPRVLRSLKAVLKNKYQIYIAENTRQAKEIMNQEKDISVLISDERMPEQLGHELLIWAKQHYPFCSRVMMTGYFDVATLQNSINEAEIFRYLTKPWDWDELKSVIDNAILLNYANTQLPQIETRKPIVDDTCACAVLDAKLDKKAVYQQLAKAQKLKIFYYKSLSELLNGIKLHPNIGLLFIDTNIGNGNAIEAVKIMHENYPYVVFIAVTEASKGADAVAMLNQGQIFKYLIKPLTATRLEPMLLASLDKYHQQKQQSHETRQAGKDQQGHAVPLWQKISQLWH